MAVETLPTLIKEWETERLTNEQAIGKLFLLLQQQQEVLQQLRKRTSKLERRLPDMQTTQLNGNG